MAPSKANTAAAKFNVRFLLEDKPWATEFKAHPPASELFDIAFDPAAVASTRFKAFVREGAHDFGELAIVTFLQAKFYDKPFVLLPLVVSGNFHHKSVAYNTDAGEITPTTMEGRKFGVRTYSQTTGVWVRGILQNDYGTDLDKVTWVTYEDAHLAEHTDPPNCLRAPGGPKTLIPMLLNNELDGGLLGGNMPDDPRLKRVIADPAGDAEKWEQEHGCRPINHMFVVTKELCNSRPDVVRGMYDMMVKVRTKDNYPFPVGFDGNWEALRLVSKYAYQQGVVGREYAPEELFADAARVLRA
ncbi:hypothetical protein [Puniceibacterium confluentis]|uniref:hypothetical protein n=1 Tax=Puniceibacterium confluentis TaxID=1958944 RepID=UPI003561CC55